MSANDYIVDATIKHQIYLGRYAGGQVREIVKELNQVLGQLELRLSRSQNLIQSKKLGAEIAAIQLLISEAMERVGSGITGLADALAAYEVGFAARVLKVASIADIATPDSVFVKALVSERPMQLQTSAGTFQDITIPQAAKAFSQKKGDELVRIIRRGFIQEKTVQDMVGEITRTVNRDKAQAEALVRTSVQHISTEARSEITKANMDIMQGHQWLSVLDDRTTVGCAALDGKIFKFGEYHPPCPRHWNCRSTLLPALMDEYLDNEYEGFRVSVGKEGPRQVSDKLTYNTWLRRQGAAFQDDVLGKTKGQLFRSGGLSLDKFVDESGAEYTLAQLRELEAGAFLKAGID